MVTGWQRKRNVSSLRFKVEKVSQSRMLNCVDFQVVARDASDPAGFIPRGPSIFRRIIAFILLLAYMDLAPKN